jgi:pimeloyl-ACP methyl ester carboxylesterase
VNATLHHELVAPAGATPHAWILMTHGIYGSGGNWRSIARKLCDRVSGWGAILVDLRGHGRSEAGQPPYTIDACAKDLHALLAARAVRVACGHSFGGKVVLALRAQTGPHELLQTWMLDASPSARPGEFAAEGNTVRRVLETLERMPLHLARREEFVDGVIASGQPPAIAQWLAMNLEPDAGGYRLRFDLRVIRALLADYYATDLWPAVEDPKMPGELHVVIAGRSTSVSHADRERLAVHQAKTGLTSVHWVADVGHWLHIDAPDTVVELLAGALPSL